MDSDNNANEDSDGGNNAQDWHVKNNAALFQSWGQKMKKKTPVVEDKVLQFLRTKEAQIVEDISPVVVISVPIQNTMAVL